MTDVVQTKPALRNRGAVSSHDLGAMDRLVSAFKGQTETVAPPEAVAPPRPISVKSIQVPIETFIGYDDNPKQRDTERHAIMAKRYHLSQSSPAQARVAAASLNGKIYKIDGHTRSYLWERGDLAKPNAVNVDLYECSSIEQVLNLYDTFDNKRAAETPADRLSGAMRLAGMTVHSAYFKSYGFTTVFMAFQGRWLTGDQLVPYLLAYRREIEMLDALDINRRIFKAGVVAGSLLLLAKYGERIIPFLDALNQNKGIKTQTECDGVQALYELIATQRQRSAWADLNALTGRTISCGERWIAGENYKTTRGGATVKTTLVGPYLKKVS